MLRATNRVLLLLTGLLLITAGTAGLATALGLVPDAWAWPWHRSDDVVLSHAERVHLREQGWFWPVVIAALSLLLVLALWWLLAQSRRPRLGEVLVDTGDGVAAVVRGRALEEALTAEAEALPGIDRARVTLVGRRTQPRLKVGLILAPQARPDEAVTALRTVAIENARRSTGLPALPAEIRMRSAGHAPERVS
ncbi:alkaline shock response membrane anchor protein AmaP [Streptomyces avicenniae]|uniref:alkaline shock response membrane anchor protein AmaP n=1 Tax=Streptomyces avicenniae TaxID=500153 RepID=UPI00069CA640|nr:alkaline shock response membrane anchor protein AmaP [Streptomyces avicenniae]